MVFALGTCGSVANFIRADVPFTIRGPGVNPSDFRMTTFASGLNYPVGMVELSDGSVMVAVSNGNSFFGSNSGSLIRLADTDGDGVADEQNILADNVPGGGLSSLRMIDDLIFATGQGNGRPISIYRAGKNPSSPVSKVGEISINYALSWLHPHSALGVRKTPGRADSYDLVFQLGSRTNFDDTNGSLRLRSDIGVSGRVAGDSIHMITITDDGKNIAGSDLRQIATGLRNAAGFAFDPETGDLYIQDNGIDGVTNPNEPTSADELNVLSFAEIGGDVEDYGFPDNYHEYRTNRVVGGSDVQPLVVFQPIPSPRGAEAEGPNDIALAPPSFPEALRNGLFVGMHGRFSLGGTKNEENPLVFVDLNDQSYFHFIENDEPDIGHLDGLLSTRDSLFVADLSPRGGFSGSNRNTGTVYQIKSLVPEPSSWALGLLGVWLIALSYHPLRSAS